MKHYIQQGQSSHYSHHHGCLTKLEANISKIKVKWIKAKGHDSYAKAMIGGFESDGRPLYIARGHYGGSLITGKAAPHLSGCNISYGGKEIVLHDFELLTIKVKQH